MLKEFIKACQKGEDLPEKTTSKPKQLDIHVALGVKAFNNLSRNQYNNIRQVLKLECENVLPTAKKLLRLEKQCYPDDITVTDTRAVIPLKNLTQLTTKRVIEAHNSEIYDKIKILPSESTPKVIHAEMIVTWGMDGTTGQSQYNQGKTNSRNQERDRTQPNQTTNNEIIEDKSLLTVSMSVQQLRHEDENGNYICLWDNENSQSVYSVRPIQLEHAKETRPLHTSMNVLTTLYDLSYKQYVQKHWLEITEEEQIVLDVEKARIKQAMWDAFNVRVLEPRQGGAGSSDTGNVARKVLENPELLAKTLYLNEEIIKRICYVLNQIRSLEPVDDLDEFDRNISDYYKVNFTSRRIYERHKIDASTVAIQFLS
ncbi:unnamed protein product [Chironomus riparius]|uniref:Uncharacterized protein n=1 Tax=Chironomus riparius TaxID=315576 RepID=A0A9N9RPA0_9DIPT|nr:unnamed protein product [Chironomus riparius]